MNKLIHTCLVLLLAAGFTGCYEDFDDPEPAKVWTDADFGGSKLISIRDFKQLFYDAYGNGSSSLAKTLEITDDYVIKGKVISSDKDGNVYKSVYIYDADSQSAIELKLMVSNYVYYQPGQTLYVKTKGLAIGNYRFMLSVGLMPTEDDIAKGYANRNMETMMQLNQHVFEGEQGEITSGDILVVTPDNYKTTLSDDALGRLVRFEGLTYKEGNFDGDKYPQYLETLYLNGSTTATYTNKYYAAEGLTPTYAYSYDNERYYGSALFTYTPGDEKSKASNFIVRVSGYSNFALEPLPAHGSQGNITAIYTKYSSKSGGYIKYQLLINEFEDIEF
ncbi:MAG: hypothetical protein IJ511_01340 [Bacteroides sp.]|nr:hypothetical protein [Bacteroides sp.]